MPKLSDQVRQLVGLENLLVKARRRHRECEREEGGPESVGAQRYRALIKRLSDEIHAADRGQLEEYLAYIENELTLRISRKAEATKQAMVEAALRIVEGKQHLSELRAEYSDALERSRSVRERLGLDPFRPLEAHFGLGVHPPNADRPLRDAHDLVKEFLKS